MANGSDQFNFIDPSVPDNRVPSEKMETKTSLRQKAQRKERFLKGPIPLFWLRNNVKSPRDRLLLILRAHSDMRNGAEFKLTADILKDAGINGRKAGYRALNALEKDGILTATRGSGKRSIVQLKKQQSYPSNG